MSNRLENKLAAMRANGERGLAPYVTAGDGGLDTTLAVLRALDRAGAVAVELGLPFSDPIADGPVLQAAAQRSLDRGTTFAGVLHTVTRLREGGSELPVVLMGYTNSLLRRGFEASCKAIAEAGADGVLLADLPVEESAPLTEAASKADLCAIYFASPTSNDERIARAASQSRGFLYAIGRLGVTGARAGLDPALAAFLARARRLAGDLPLAVGFGISTADQVRAVTRDADVAIVGSAMVARIHAAFSAHDGGPAAAAHAAEDFARDLRKGLEG